MLDAGNSVSSMEKMIYIIGEAKNKSKDKYEEFLEHIEREYGNGDLEPENYELVQRTLRAGVESYYQDAFDEKVPKMINYLEVLRQKIDEYSKISG
ncbi:MAG: hypothetical protein IPN39_07935 [Chitinophagaceae bacterium]|nr:hypothetical protein [Chitinophagaceae bacterium]